MIKTATLRRPDKLEQMADLLKRIETHLAIIHNDLRDVKAIYRSLSDEALSISNDINL